LININKFVGVTFLSIAFVLTGCSSYEGVENSVDSNALQKALPYQKTPAAEQEKEKTIVENVETDFWPEMAKFKMREGTVTDILKGDVIEINGTERVRLLGIKANHSNEKRTRIYHEIPEEKTIQFLKDLLQNKKVYIEQNPEYPSDTNGETLAYVWIGDSEQLKNVNALLLKEGLAITERMDPASVYDATFKRIENEARTNQIGLWNNSNH
jgi:micrococcal nuclease